MNQPQRMLLVASVWLYTVIGIVTFGHAWAFICLASDIGMTSRDPVVRFIASTLCGVAWPLYWSGWFWCH